MNLSITFSMKPPSTLTSEVPLPPDLCHHHLFLSTYLIILFVLLDTYSVGLPHSNLCRIEQHSEKISWWEGWTGETSLEDLQPIETQWQFVQGNRFEHKVDRCSKRWTQCCPSKWVDGGDGGMEVRQRQLLAFSLVFNHRISTHLYPISSPCLVEFCPPHSQT